MVSVIDNPNRFKIIFQIIFYLCVFNFFNTYLFAQTIIPRFETLNVNEGLSQSSVYALHQDKFGFMWIGTADGLNRFDGSELKIFKVQNDKLDIESNCIRGYLAEDEKGNIWFSNESGIYCFDQLKQKIITKKIFEKEEFANSSFVGIMISNEFFWMINATQGVFSFSINTNEIKHYKHPVFTQKSDNYFFNTSVGSNRNFWFAYTDDRGLWHFDTKSKLFSEYNPKQHFIDIQFAKQKHYLITIDAVFVYDSIKKTTQKCEIWGKDKSFVTAKVFEDEKQRIWATSKSRGLAYYDLRYRQVWHLKHQRNNLKSLPIDLTTCYCIDKANNLWIGTDGGGVSILDLKAPKFNLFPQNESEHSNMNNFFTKSIYEDAQQRIWVGTHDAGLNIIEPNTLKVKNISTYNGKPLKAIGAIFEDKQHNIWIGHSMGLMIFNEVKNTFNEIPLSRKIPLEFGNIYINDIKELPNGEILAATQWGLLLVSQKNGKYFAKDYYHIQNFGSQSLYLSISKNGNIWVASPNIGLSKMRFSNDSLSFKASYFKGVNIRSVFIDDDENILWLATAKGLVWFDTRTLKFKVYNEKDGMANSFVYGILKDEKSNFWLSTNGGLIYFDRANYKFHNYTVNDGLQSNEFNTGAYFKGASGHFYFGGIKGFNWFSSLSFKNNDSINLPKVALTEILINDEYFPQNEQFLSNHSLKLPYQKNKLSLSFSILDFTKPKANKICYKLMGRDKDWVCTKNKKVVYQNLTPGIYELVYKGMNGNEQESKVQHLQINIQQPYWKTWWFVLSIFIIILGSTILWLRMYTQKAVNKKIRILEKQKAIEEERNRISKDMHDEIGSGLTHIALISELIQTQQKTENELRKDVGNISHAAQKLVASMSEIIWALNPQNDTLENLLSYLREQIINYFEPFDIDYEIDFPEIIPTIILSNEKRRNLFLVAKESLNNALKYAEAKTITFHVKIDTQLLTFNIQDNGIGFDTNKIRRGANGLINMQKRMKDIGGTFVLETSKKGTQIKIEFPLSINS